MMIWVDHRWIPFWTSSLKHGFLFREYTYFLLLVLEKPDPTFTMMYTYVHTAYMNELNEYIKCNIRTVHVISKVCTTRWAVVDIPHQYIQYVRTYLYVYVRHVGTYTYIHTVHTYAVGTCISFDCITECGTLHIGK